MKRCYLLLLLPVLLFSKPQIEHLTIHDNDFYIITDTYDIYDSKGRVMKFYREENNYDMTHLFHLTLEDKTGTCSARSVQEGHYEINGSEILLYTLWGRQGRIYDVPYGARIQHYHIQSNGTLKLLESRLYVETAAKSFDKESAMRFLFTPPQSEADIKALEGYVRSVEKQYKGKFLFGKEAEALIKEVKAAIDRKNRNRWR